MPIMKDHLSRFYPFMLKPFFDLIFATIFLVVLLPLLLILCFIIFFDLKSSPFYVQTRIGKDDEPFKLYKLRSLRVDGDMTSTTKLSRFIRSLSLDELPQLINIVKMDMSFVGPRPLLPEYLDYYTEWEKQRHQVTPGMTGLAQLRIGNSSDWSRRMELDLEYIRKISFWFDLKLLLSTFISLLQFKRKSKKDIQITSFDEFARNR